MCTGVPLFLGFSFFFYKHFVMIGGRHRRTAPACGPSGRCSDDTTTPVSNRAVVRTTRADLSISPIAIVCASISGAACIEIM